MTAEAQLWALGEVALAILLGGIIGLEREMAERPAGFRTHMLVAGAAALLVALSNALLLHFDDDGSGSIRTDPVRIAEAIIAGVSFLGAGTVFQRQKGERVEGLTTAASLLLCSGVGIAVALHQFILAIGTTILALVVLRGVKMIERRLSNAPDKP
jgi:putative Mg2+ transporter-C (MgtC) family protein